MRADCTIIFENCVNDTLHGGQEVTGLIDIRIQKFVKIRKLTLYIEGIGECAWKEVHGHGENTNTEYFHGLSKFIDTVTYLIPNETEMQPGLHTFNFKIQVPLGAPTSVNEKYGRNHYQLRIVFDRPWKRDYEFTRSFSVIQPFDLNLDPKYRTPLQKVTKDDLGIILNASIPQKGFVVGQSISIKVFIDNPSEIEIKHVEVLLKKHIVYTSHTPYSKKKNGEVNVHKMCQGTSFKKGKQEQNIEFVIPKTVPSTYSHNQRINVVYIYYELIIKAETPFFYKSPFVSFLITIGTVPITESNAAGTDINILNCMISSQTDPPLQSTPSAPTHIGFSDFQTQTVNPIISQSPNSSPNSKEAQKNNYDLLLPTTLESFQSQINIGFSNEIVPSAPSAPRQIDFSDFQTQTVDPTISQSPNSSPHPKEVQNNELLLPTTLNSFHPPINIGFSNEIGTSPPIDPNAPPPSYEEATNNLMPSENTDIGFSNPERPIGSVMPEVVKKV